MHLKFHPLRHKAWPLHLHQHHRLNHHIITTQYSLYPNPLRRKKESMTSARTMLCMSSHKTKQQLNHHGKIPCQLCLATRSNGTRSAFSQESSAR
jgi:hypothetical protein